MFIFNSIENFLFSKNPIEDSRKVNSNPTSEISNFNEILHQAVNDASRFEPDKLQSYSVPNKELSESTEVNASSPLLYRTESFSERLHRETSQSLESFSESIASSSENNSMGAINLSNSYKIQDNSEEIQNTNITSNIKPEEEDELEEKVSNKNVKKEMSSEMLLQVALLIQDNNGNQKVKTENTEKKNSDKNELKIEIKSVDTKSENDNKESQEIKKSDVGKQSDLKDLKKADIKVISNEISELKVKENKIEPEVKSLPRTEKVIETKTSSKSELSAPAIKTKNNNSNQVKISSEGNPESSALNASKVTLGLEIENSSLSKLIQTENRKSKKNSEIESKEKSNSENVKNIPKEFTGVEKEMRLAKETLIEVSGLNKGKWTITRQEKEKEMAITERKKESVSLLNEISSKSSSPQTSSDSDKSFSNPRYEMNGFKSFTETMKMTNADKPKEAGFEKENFSRSLNDLVTKARINIVENGKNSAQISLYPKDLGKMTLNIDVTKERVDGKILVDSEFIKSRLMSDVSQLKADLKANGLDLQSISIEVRNESSQAFDFANPSNEKESSKENSTKSNSSLSQNANLEEDVVGTEYSQKSYNLVDIKI